MGYRIEYQKTAGMHQGRLLVLTMLCFFSFLILIYKQWPEGAGIIRGLLWDAKNSAPVAALEAFAKDLQNGDAVQAFSGFLQRLTP
ncbi:MAG: hypothetical protein U0N82_05640 [Oscillospiraceae bacterium]